MADISNYEVFALSKLREAGHRITTPRRSVVHVLATAERPLTPTGIHLQVASNGGRLDVVSVYRILSTLQRLGLVHHIGSVDAYSACRLEQRHEGGYEHLICTRCGRVEEAEVSQVGADMVRDQAQRVGFAIQAIRVEVLGVCPECGSLAMK